jgi:hypothetical protein
MRIHTIALAMLFSCVAALAADASGVWTVIVDAPSGPIEATMTLKQDGEKVTGVLSSQRGDVPVAGTMKSDDLTVTSAIPEGTLTITAKVTDAAISGTLDYAGQATIPIKGTKKPKD